MRKKIDAVSNCCKCCCGTFGTHYFRGKEVLLITVERKNPDWNIIKKSLLEARTRVWMDHDYYETHELKQLKLRKKLEKKYLIH